MLMWRRLIPMLFLLGACQDPVPCVCQCGSTGTAAPGTVAMTPEQAAQASVNRVKAKTPAQIDQELKELDEAVKLEESPDSEVLFNQLTRKVHALDCRWGMRCTKNCIKVTRAKAKEMGGIPCGSCNGGGM